MTTYNYMEQNLYEIKDNEINSNFKAHQINDFDYKENNNYNLYSNTNNPYNNSNNYLSEFYRNNELTQAEKLLLGQYKSNYNKKYGSINYLEINNFDKKEHPLNPFKTTPENLPYNNYNDYYLLDNYNPKLLLNNENEIPMTYLGENYINNNNNKYKNINYPLNNPIINEEVNIDYNNKRRGENYFKINQEVYPSQNFGKYLIPLSTNKDTNNYNFNNFKYFEEPRNNILNKTQNILNNTYIENPYINPKIQYLKRNYSSNNVFYKNQYNNFKNKDIQLIKNNNNEFSNKRNNNNLKINNLKNIQNSINNINSNKKFYNSYTPEIRKKSNPFIKKKYLENSNEKSNINNINNKKTKKIKYNTDARSKKTKNKIDETNKINKEIVKPYKYIPSISSVLINNNEKNLNKNNTKGNNPNNPSHDEKKNIYNIPPSKTNYKGLKNKSTPKIRNNPETKNPYLYKTYQINTIKKNKKNKEKQSLFNYSSIISDLINKNTKNYIKF